MNYSWHREDHNQKPDDVKKKDFMELVSLYIKSFKGISDLWVPCNSRFTLHIDSNQQVHIKKNPYGDAYYQGTSCTLLLGKNGAGKTTILEFIEALLSDADHSGLAVWHHDSKYTVQTINMPPPDINFDEVKFETGAIEIIPSMFISIFLKRNALSLLKISNINDITKVLFRDKRKKPLALTDRSLSRLTVSQKRKSVELDKIIDYLENAPGKPESLNEVNILPGVYFTPPASDRFLDISQRYNDDRDFIDNCINLFGEKIIKTKDNNTIKTPSSDDELLEIYKYLPYLKHSPSPTLRPLIREITEPLRRKNVKDITTEEMIRSLFPSLVWTVLSGIKEQKLKEQLSILALIHITFCELNDVPEALADYIAEKLPSDISPAEKKSIETGIALLERELGILLDIFGILSINTVEMTMHGDRLLFSSRETGVIITADSYIKALSAPCFNAFTMYWSGLSSGESAIIYLLSNIWEELKKQRASPHKNVLILIDEVDLYLHPEWQRTILSHITQLITRVRPDGKTQLIMSTHSPVIASDFLPNDTVTLAKVKNKIAIGNTQNVGFGSTISEFMLENFFLDATIGKLAFDEITKLLDNKHPSSPEADYLKSQIKNDVLNKMLKINSSTIKNDNIKPAGDKNDLN